MDKLFLAVLTMSWQASLIALLILAIRFLVSGHLPKRIITYLWLPVFLRMVLPDSLFPKLLTHGLTPAPIPANIGTLTQYTAGTSAFIVNRVVDSNRVSYQQFRSANPSQIVLFVLSLIWAAGIVALLLYTAVTFAALAHRLATSVRTETNIYVSDQISSPFVFGMLRPRIYLPLNLHDDVRLFVLAHERAHIHRRDHIMKPLFFLALCLHWWNPLLWLCWFLFCRDLELACDEAVLQNYSPDMRISYAETLLALASPRRPLLTPIAFGESSIKIRIQKVLKWSKPSRRATVFSLLLCSAVILLCACNNRDTSVPNGPPAADASSAAQSSASPSEKGGLSYTPLPASVALNTLIGADPAALDYADDNLIIFHGPFGLFVYDLQKQNAVASLNLSVISCADTQGDNTCEVTVSPDAKTIYLHPMSITDMYVFDWQKNILTQTSYAKAEHFDNLEPISQPDSTGSASYNAVPFSDGTQGYLLCDDFTLKTLSYVRGDERFPLFREDNTAPAVPPEASVYNNDSREYFPVFNFFSQRNSSFFVVDKVSALQSFCDQKSWRNVQDGDTLTVSVPARDDGEEIVNWVLSDCWIGTPEKPAPENINLPEHHYDVIITPEVGNRASFAVPHNSDYALSSAVYPDGILRVFSITTTFKNGDEAVYLFIICSNIPHETQNSLA